MEKFLHLKLMMYFTCPSYPYHCFVGKRLDPKDTCSKIMVLQWRYKKMTKYGWKLTTMARYPWSRKLPIVMKLHALLLNFGMKLSAIQRLQWCLRQISSSKTLVSSQIHQKNFTVMLACLRSRYTINHPHLLSEQNIKVNIFIQILQVHSLFHLMATRVIT